MINCILRKIPDDWEVVKLKDICELVRGTEPGSKTYNKDGTGFRFIRVSDISKRVLESVFIDEKPNKLIFCNKEDILMSLDGVPGVVNKGFEGAISSGIRMIKPKDLNISKEFLFYILQHRIVQRIIENYTTGTTIKHASRAIDFIKIPLPPFPEQRAIAEILSTADEAVQKVDEIIAKTERLKKGLMQELLTKGIGHKEFKDTEIGRIPKEWEVVKLDEVVEINKESKNPVIEFPDNKFLYVDIESVENGTGVIKNIKEILGKDAPSRARRVIHYNDVVMSTVRPYLKAFAIVLKEYDNQICSTGFAVLTCKEGMSPFYLLYAIFSDFVIEQCNKMMMGGQYPALNSSQVARIKIPLPLLPEQQKISSILSTVDKKLELERSRKEKFERIKRGLMNDLLTGRKRIKNLNKAQT